MNIEKIKEKLKQDKENRLNNVINYFNNMKFFKTVDDIPDIPVFKDQSLYENVVVKNLIRCGAIPKDKLKIGQKYLGSCRNAEEAIWDGKEFNIKRYKFGIWENDTLNHFQDDDGYDVFVPIKEIN